MVGRFLFPPALASERLLWAGAFHPAAVRIDLLADSIKWPSPDLYSHVGKPGYDYFPSASKPHAKASLSEFQKANANRSFLLAGRVRFEGETFSAELDLERLASQLERVKTLMLDGKWRGLGQIARDVNGSEAGVSARLRDLRKEGFVVNKRRVGPTTSGLWFYQVLAEPIFSFDKLGQGILLES